MLNIGDNFCVSVIISFLIVIYYFKVIKDGKPLLKKKNQDFNVVE